MKTTDEKLPGAAASSKGAAPQQNPKHPDNWRETIESVVVAFVLAFLFRTFEAEAFVIPTGSMAPTLYGQQRDVTCTKCGTRFAVGVRTGQGDSEVQGGELVHDERSHFAFCPNANCRFPNDVLDDEMFAGDRILVNKFPYEFADPQRWDVVVFKYPIGAKTNYIKRLVGLPGEELRIENGDIKVRPLGSEDNVPFRVARKTPEKQRHLQLPVHDNDHPARELLETGWPEAWAAEVSAEAPSAWAPDAKARSFRVDPDAVNADRLHWLRYTHYVPRADDWMQALAGKHRDHDPQPQQIKDFYAYNGRITVLDARGKTLPDVSDLRHAEPAQWVGDLTLSCQVEVLATGGEVTFELVEGHRQYRCTIDLTNGNGQFQYVHRMDRESENIQDAGEAFETGLNRPGRYSVSFANVDDRLCFWVDDRLMKFLDFEPESKFEPQKMPIFPTDRDTSPVGIAAQMAKLRVDHLRIERDTFYLHTLIGSEPGEHRVYTLKDEADDGEDEFLMLGDNSPQSNDSRAWQASSTLGIQHSPYAVPRHLLIGKAFYVYWPHGVPFLNGGKGFPIGEYKEPQLKGRGETNSPLPKFSLPFYPDVKRMHRIR